MSTPVNRRRRFQNVLVRVLPASLPHFLLARAAGALLGTSKAPIESFSLCWSSGVPVCDVHCLETSSVVE